MCTKLYLVGKLQSNELHCVNYCIIILEARLEYRETESVNLFRKRRS